MRVKTNPRSSMIIETHVHRKHSPSSSLEPEARELQRCADSDLETRHIKPICLIDYDSDSNQLTTESIVGRELFHTLWNATYLLGRLRKKNEVNLDLVTQRIAELGEWLALYHQSTAYKERSFSPGDWLITAFQAKVDRIREAELISNLRLDRIRDHFLGTIEQYVGSGSQMPEQAKLCQVHGDFTIYNVLIETNYNLRVLDFGDTRKSTNLEDVARFYSSVWAISRTNRRRKILLSPILAQFLQAYGVKPGVEETPFFKCNLAYNYLTYLQGHHFMQKNGFLSWNSSREMAQITQAGIQWIETEVGL